MNCYKRYYMTDWSSEQHPPAPQSVRDLILCIREDYKSDVLLESTVSPDPYVQFEKWLQRAKDNNFFEPHGINSLLSTSLLYLLTHTNHSSTTRDDVVHCKYSRGTISSNCTPPTIRQARLCVLYQLQQQEGATDPR